MLLTLILLSPLSLLLHPITTSAHPNTSCKAVPDTRSWPSPSSWSTLNTTLSGHLLAPLPPAAVCHPSLPQVYNNASCTFVTAQYTNSSFHAMDPVSMDSPNWEDDACLPDPSHACDVGQFPSYVVNATTKEMVKTGVDFAREKGVRLVVRGTGHDYLGRSTAPGVMSIYTHNLRGLKWDDAFVPTGCKASPQPAVIAASGHRMGEIYDFIAPKGYTIVGGEDPDVGIGGYVTGGGHSLISAQ